MPKVPYSLFTVDNSKIFKPGGSCFECKFTKSQFHQVARRHRSLVVLFAPSKAVDTQWQGKDLHRTTCPRSIRCVADFHSRRFTPQLQAFGSVCSPSSPLDLCQTRATTTTRRWWYSAGVECKHLESSSNIRAKNLQLENREGLLFATSPQNWMGGLCLEHPAEELRLCFPLTERAAIVSALRCLRTDRQSVVERLYEQ